MSDWQPIETAPKDGRTIELRGELLAHHMEGCKFSIMPGDWRPETPQTEWRLTGWREVAQPSDQQAHAEKLHNTVEPPYPFGRPPL